jgi:hypothetical protein
VKNFLSGHVVEFSERRMRTRRTMRTMRMKSGGDENEDDFSAENDYPAGCRENQI